MCRWKENNMLMCRVGEAFLVFGPENVDLYALFSDFGVTYVV